MSDPIAKLLLPFSQSPRGPLVRDQAATVALQGHLPFQDQLLQLELPDKYYTVLFHFVTFSLLKG